MLAGFEDPNPYGNVLQTRIRQGVFKVGDGGGHFNKTPDSNRTTRTVWWLQQYILGLDHRELLAQRGMPNSLQGIKAQEEAIRPIMRAPHQYQI